MKTLPLLFLIATVAGAQTPPPGARSSVAPAPTTHSAAELSALEQFLNLPDVELAQMADAIARVRAMTPAQREQLRREIAAYRRLPEQQRLQLRQGWGWMPTEIRAGWREMMQHATPAERAAIQAKMQSLAPADRMQYRRGLVEAYLKSQATK